uniref:Uncharacterized protein n=1 Tax=Anguilla anguilla TaxID=7936 RepID=A0A0E9SU58_ANGAN
MYRRQANHITVCFTRRRP